MKKLICYLFGHKYIKQVEIDNGRSKYGTMLCQRCDKAIDYQFDYDISQYK